MSPLGVNVTTNEQLQPGAGGLLGAGVAFIAVHTDAGPPPGPPFLPYVPCRSINDLVLAFGERSSASADAYDWVDTYFQEGGKLVYVTRDSDDTAAFATLTLNDATPHPSVLVDAGTRGTDGNRLQIQVTRTPAATFTGTTTSTSASVTAVSSFANIGVGTPVTGAGIPAGTYVATVTPGSSTLTLSANATASASAVTITPATFTVSVLDEDDEPLEEHGPFKTTAELYAEDTNEVTFAQSAGSGFTVNVPVASGPTNLTGGADASDLTDTTQAAALGNFPKTLGPGTVALPGVDSDIGWTALDAHAKANNRFAAKDIPDSASVSALIASIGAFGSTPNASYGLFAASSLIIPGLTPVTTRTVAASAAIAALRARVASTGNENQAPAGQKWPLRFVTGFTHTYDEADTISLNSAGINTFQTPDSGLGLPALCLAGFSSPVSPNVDPIYWQATAACERMALVAEAEGILKSHLFDPLDGQLLTVSAAQHDLQAMLASHWTEKALYGDTAADAGSVVVAPPVNTPTTAQLGELNAALTVRITQFVNSANAGITVIPITASINPTA